MNNLLFTITAPSLSLPIDSSFNSSGQIIVDINQYQDNVDPDKLPKKIGPINGNVLVKNTYPKNTQFTSIKYTGKPLLLYDGNNTLLDNNSTNYSKVKKIVAGIDYTPPSSSDNRSNNTLAIILTIIIIIIGFSIGIYFYLKSNIKKSLIEKSDSLFIKGE
jgi:hypothetical protein